jgi:hypothetical protein
MNRERRPSRPLTGLAIAALLFAAGAGCGDDDTGPEGSDAQQIRALYEEFQDAALAADGDAACERLTADARREVRQLASVTMASSGDCAAALSGLMKASKASGLVQKRAVVKGVRVDGDSATAMLSDGGRKPVPTEVVREDGEWKLTTLGSTSIGAADDAGVDADSAR